MSATHNPSFHPVASGAGRIVCSCGWRSRVQDDGYMFDPGHIDVNHEFAEHLREASGATHAGTIEDFLRRRECGIWTAADTAHILGHIRLVEAVWKELVKEYTRQ